MNHQTSINPCWMELAKHLKDYVKSGWCISDENIQLSDDDLCVFGTTGMLMFVARNGSKLKCQNASSDIAGRFGANVADDPIWIEAADWKQNESVRLKIESEIRNCLDAAIAEAEWASATIESQITPDNRKH